MTALLAEAISRASAQPDPEQDRVARLMLAALDAADDQAWDDAFAASQDTLSHLAARSRAHREAGRTKRVGT